MNTLSAEPGEGITSELIDLDAVSLDELRDLDDADLHRSLDHVVKQTGKPSMSAGNSSSIGLID